MWSCLLKNVTRSVLEKVRKHKRFVSFNQASVGYWFSFDAPHRRLHLRVYSSFRLRGVDCVGTIRFLLCSPLTRRGGKAQGTCRVHRYVLNSSSASGSAEFISQPGIVAALLRSKFRIRGFWSDAVERFRPKWITITMTRWKTKK